MDAPRRLQTALGLYSSDLCGLVVLVDSPPPHYSGLAKRIARAAHQSTEFHFPSIDQQLDKIVEDVKLPVSYLCFPVANRDNQNGNMLYLREACLEINFEIHYIFVSKIFK